MASFTKYRADEVLSKSLNTGEDAIKIENADIATIKADIALIKADIAAIKVTTDKLDACIDTSNNKLNVSTS